MKLLFFMSTLRQGGAERVIANLANEFAGNGRYEVTLCLGCRGEFEYSIDPKVQLVDLKIPLPKKKYTPKWFAIVIERIYALRATLAKEKPDELIAFLPTSVFISYAASRGSAIPLIVSQRNDPYWDYPKLPIKFVFKYIFSHSDGCVFQNSQQVRFFSAKVQKHSRIIANLVSDKFFSLSHPADRKGIIGAGRISPQKRWDVAIRAFAKIADRIEDNFYIYGDDELGEKSKCEVLIAQLGMVTRIFLCESVDDIEQKMNKSRLFVISSDYEGTPNALIEALVVGVPCLSTKFDGGGAKEIIKDGVNGLLVPKADVDALADAMLRILTDEKFAQSLSKNTEKHREKYNRKTVFEQWENFIKEVARKDVL